MAAGHAHRPKAARSSFVRGPDRGQGLAYRQRTDDRRRTRPCAGDRPAPRATSTAADPTGKGRTLQFDAVAGEDLRLPIEWSVVAVFADQHLGEQRRRRQAAGDRPFRRGRLSRGLARATGIFRARDAQYAGAGREPSPASRGRSRQCCAGHLHSTDKRRSRVDHEQHLQDRRPFAAEGEQMAEKRSRFSCSWTNAASPSIPFLMSV
jgi:hypothetical protein